MDCLMDNTANVIQQKHEDILWITLLLEESNYYKSQAPCNISNMVKEIVRR